ncbi:hypothetical protein IE81DRAFT_324308 [Ceraceosorus guamensis]|uniref:Snf7-domain-containing protein n=1 Tax=Ceraceosorus guamensis TaxID=1522189 RepID=A0A316VZ56_9BASI|nr:hypothetical protein IE81DRAFT_324308 [Ceraceosorus guamensis]PWN41683.1 hypothetical protein IE81DRAFT_324308 [Ceraceosorus guamensis]
MNRLFGSRQAAPKPSLDEAIKSTDARAEGVQAKIRNLDVELAKYRDQLKRAQGAGRNAIQQRALRVLKQKRLYEGQYEQLVQQSYNMAQADLTTENLRNTMATVSAMDAANKEMRKTYGKIDLDKIERTNDEMQDLMEMANEVQESLGRQYEVPDDINEDELQAELDALGDDVAAEALTEGATPSYLNNAEGAKELDGLQAPTDQIGEAGKQEAVRAV